MILLRPRSDGLALSRVGRMAAQRAGMVRTPATTQPKRKLR
jgi:hypothetical protein